MSAASTVHRRGEFETCHCLTRAHSFSSAVAETEENRDGVKQHVTCNGTAVIAWQRRRMECQTSLRRGAGANDWKVMKLYDAARITLSTGETMPRSGENFTFPLFDEAMQIQSPLQSRQSSGSRLQTETPSSSRGASLSNTRPDAKRLLSWISLPCTRHHYTDSRWPVAPTASVTHNTTRILDWNAKAAAI